MWGWQGREESLGEMESGCACGRARAMSDWRSTARDTCYRNLFVGHGKFLPLVMETSHALPESGLSNEVSRFNTNNSLDEIGRQRAFSAFDAVVIIEKHIVSGGFRGAVAKWRNEKALHHGMFDSHRRVGLCLARGRSGMREQFSLTMKSIVEPVRPLLP